MNELKVYQVCDEDWVCAKSQQEAVEWYLKETGLEKEDIYFLDMIVEADLDLNDMYEDEDRENKISFREALNQNIASGFKAPYIFCSTEY